MVNILIFGYTHTMSCTWGGCMVDINEEFISGFSYITQSCG